VGDRGAYILFAVLVRGPVAAQKDEHGRVPGQRRGEHGILQDGHPARLGLNKAVLEGDIVL
jgi:hypothetical protein